MEVAKLTKRTYEGDFLSHLFFLRMTELNSLFIGIVLVFINVTDTTKYQSYFLLCA
ncbi:hypothetical protein VCHA43P277_160084 [Vibrio chagasii]|nr:hypothetical protein VCHA34P126_140090 [Vibrio chagasii]CAH6985088.1 hypothetical protein VCHA43P277_160084 [Vibrio chagasii]CAH7033292.1 hypothetical protein VCHA41O247_160085 [Vibrio chagasii]CAH7241998.1 hypothetical protein VCHA50P420_160039 [Vibrio chagasii]